MKARGFHAMLMIGAAFASVLAVVGAGSASATATTVPIGVDQPTPAGHNFASVDFFPREDVRVHSGTVLDFAWAANPDGFHTATLLKKGETPEQAWDVAHRAIVGDPDDGHGQLQLDPQGIVLSTRPPAGTPAPGACGDAATPCPFDGTSDLSSGGHGTDGTTHFFAQLGVAPGTTVHFICLVHRGMEGEVKVVGSDEAATPLSSVSHRADEQRRADNREGVKAEHEALKAAAATSHEESPTVIAGTHSRHVEVLEMLPATVHVDDHTRVHFVTKTAADIHTVTFPQSTEEGDPLPFFCEAPGADTPFDFATAPPGPPCGNPFLLEDHYNPAPFGATAIATPSTVGSSQLLSNEEARWPGTDEDYTYSFPNNGTFTYKCHIHDHMLGTVVAS